MQNIRASREAYAATDLSVDQGARETSSRKSRWGRETYAGALCFNVAAFLLPALYGTLSKLWIAHIDSSMVATSDVYTYIMTLAEVINEVLPRAAWSTIATRPAGPARLSLAYTLLLAQMFLGFILAIVLVSTSQSFTDTFVPELARAKSITYVRISSFSTFSSAVQAAIAAASRALDQPDVPLVLSSVKFAVNIVLDLLLISTFHVRTEDPTVEMQAGIQLTCNMTAALLGVLYFVFTNASCRKYSGMTTESTTSRFAALKILVRPGLITFAESAVRNVLYLWLGSTIVALGSTYATAWGVFNTIRWGLAMVPVSALEASTLTFPLDHARLHGI
ncbi:hypothetical protein VFPFJ_10941 [Purpureocillium lilacinum]|uniref:Transmembrane protein n=1 Tax=Purpureocillium lilacinum TaxID=33203 RepID=A0A179G9A4_PURLI|nr:hypothetical protein VFPFJ_10941 [Purpureocillium lilacinum]OAQ74395.1 hypothetical protein VFPFJ_10941 [Purpureocillium lilacinum]